MQLYHEVIKENFLEISNICKLNSIFLDKLWFKEEIKIGIKIHFE